ncbi:NEL-type E3 ubiquitin ligase domain-containing protein [Pseudomonas sp. NY15374]|uniref:NEL-type E3 ubiquitin ligase domain-containing protein n=1 Tax=Pseudomonas sp. NY15374 TaxID=3400357 RepID=UPI003A840007
MPTPREQREEDATTVPDFPALHQDAVIGERLPDWLRQASPEQVKQLHEAMQLSVYFQTRAQAIMGQLEPLDSFAQARLTEALKPHVDEPFDVRTLQFRRGHREPVLTSIPIGYPVTVPVYTQIPLLEAALGNFREEETEDGGQLPGNRLGDPGNSSARLPSARHFAVLCRSLDLGGQYQRHLHTVLEQYSDSEAGADSVFGRAHRYGMLADACVARLKGVLSENEYVLVKNLCAQKAPLTFEGRPVQCKRLSLLACTLEQIVVLDVRDETFSPLYSSSHRVLVHIPGDPATPWSAFPNLRYFANDLGKRLRLPGYQRFFSRFVLRRDAQSFFSAVASGYQGVSDLANIALEEHMHPWEISDQATASTLEGSLFIALGRARIAQVKADAAMIAVPSAAVDEQVRREHDQRLSAEGWALLSIAGLFVPALGAVLLAVSAWQLLGEVYHGVEAWHEGDSSEALDHLLNVAGDVAMIAVTAAGAQLARAAWSRSALVDSLLPVRLEDGSTRLWKEDLTPFRSAPPAGAVRDDLGVYRAGEGCWVEMDGQHYRVAQGSDQRWRLQGDDKHAPVLRHNGAGSWRLWWEQPLEWDDPRRSFRRLGHDFAELDDDQIDEILLAHDIQAQHLRAVHVEGRVAHGEWQDSVVRYRLDLRIRRVVRQLRGGVMPTEEAVLDQARLLPGAAGASDQALAELIWSERRRLFEQLYALEQPPGNAGVQRLCRQFASLHGRAAAQLMREASVVDRQRLLDDGRVAMDLASKAGAAVWRIRVARVFEGLYLDASQNADLARVALQVLDTLPGASHNVAWRLCEGSANGPVLLSIDRTQAVRTLTLVHTDGDFLLLDGATEAVLGEGELFEVLSSAMDGPQREALGLGEPLAHNLRVTLARATAARRADVQTMLGRRASAGWFRAPQRLADGRVGYPLSGRGGGRGRGRPLFARVRNLYPNLSDNDARAWLVTLGNSGGNIHTELSRLEDELAVLETDLQLWTNQPMSLSARGERVYMRDALLAAWRRTLPRVYDQNGRVIGQRLNLWTVSLQSLPELSQQVRFDQVVSLSLRGIGLTEISSTFMRAFSRLEVLELPNNRLTRLPPRLRHLSRLRELDLTGNQIMLDDRQATTLLQLTHLRLLDLSYNPLGRSFSVAGMPHLNSLQLAHTGISELPEGLLSRGSLVVADLRHNAIVELPDHFFSAPRWYARAVLLSENPLSATSTQRLRSFMIRHQLIIEEELEAENVSDQAEEGAAALDSARSAWQHVIEAGATAQFDEYWNGLAEAPGSADFMALLRRLLETLDFRNHGADLGRRVTSMMLAMREHAELREELFTQAMLPRTCQDSVIGNFSRLEVRMLVWKALVDAKAGAQDAALVRLGRQLWRLDEIERIAVDDIAARVVAGRDPDEVEVELAYRVMLRDDFDLPAQPADIAYQQTAGLTPERLAAARQRLREGETEQAMVESLFMREFWTEHLKNSHQAEFDAIKKPFFERIEVVQEMAGNDSSGARSYDDTLQALRDEVQRLEAQSGQLSLQADGLRGDALEEHQQRQADIDRQLREQLASLEMRLVDSEFAERMRALGTGMDSQTFRQTMDLLSTEHDAAVQARIIELTRAALAQNPSQLEPGASEPQPGPSRGSGMG